MEQFSGSTWHKTENSRDLNTYKEVSGWNSRAVSRDSGNRKETNRVVLARRNLENQVGFSGNYRDEDPFSRKLEWGDVSLRQWLDKPERPVDEFECLHIFRQIVEIVNVAHSQGIVVHNVRPSCFVMSSLNNVSFIESASCSESSSEEDVVGLNRRVSEDKNPSSSLPSEDFTTNALSEASCIQSNSVNASRVPNEDDKIVLMNVERDEVGEEERRQPFPMKQILVMEASWYASPEEVSGSTSSCASDIYRLGVLLFELFCPFSSREDKSITMSSLRHRVLPPQLLLKWPKEASYCLWLLHPEPNSRPKMGELLQSEFLNEQRENLDEREAQIKLKERIDDQELLLEFLLLIQQRKQEAADKLQDTVSLLCSDIEEVSRHRTLLKNKRATFPVKVTDDNLELNLPQSGNVETDDSSCLSSRKRFRPGIQALEFDDSIDDGQNSNQITESQENLLIQNPRLMENLKKLEAAYFMTRCRPIRPRGKSLVGNSAISSDVTERSSINNLVSKVQHTESRQRGWIGPFLEGLCKYLSYSKVKVKADLKQGDFLNSSNLVCSLSFDRDGEFFATAGVNKKIKVFECDSLVKENRDIHYPVVEMASRSKLSSICWNSYIKNQIASSNFEGVVQVWDVTRSQVLTEMKEHERRVWSIDFSSADPTMLASGSDDSSVKLWNINQGVSIGTIRTKANVCSVQFPSDSSRNLAFGSADHRVYYYDLRNSKVPLCTLAGHTKTVSYVRFVDSTTLVSASTDNTIKLWDLSKGASTPLQSFTGHLNIKNFVGLSVADGYIATGSETNEVFIYHKAFPMPALSYKFNTTDPVSGQETDDTNQFISSVCWRGQSSMLVAANSTGNIKILEMV